MEKEIILLDKEAIAKITGWGSRAINNLFQDENFPAIKVGQKNQVELDAFKTYLSQRRTIRGD